MGRKLLFSLYYCYLLFQIKKSEIKPYFSQKRRTSHYEGCRSKKWQQQNWQYRWGYLRVWSSKYWSSLIYYVMLSYFLYFQFFGDWVIFFWQFPFLCITKFAFSEFSKLTHEHALTWPEVILSLLNLKLERRMYLHSQRCYPRWRWKKFLTWTTCPMKMTRYVKAIEFWRPLGLDQSLCVPHPHIHLSVLNFVHQKEKVSLYLVAYTNYQCQSCFTLEGGGRTTFLRVPFYERCSKIWM